VALSDAVVQSQHSNVFAVLYTAYQQTAHVPSHNDLPYILPRLLRGSCQLKTVS